jgi:hypothetical protein
MEGTPNQRCQLGKIICHPKAGKIIAGAHGQESMNFSQGEYDAEASLASAQRQDHSARGSSSRTSMLAVAADFEIHLNSALKFTFGGTLELVSKFTL